MDPQKCLDILCSRARCEHGGTDALKFCNACEMLPSPDAAPSSSSAAAKRDGGDEVEVNDTEFTELSKLELVNLVCSLQSQRVQGYEDYTKALDVLIEEVRIGEYASLCGEMTARFSVISNQIIKLEKKIRKLGLVEVANCIQKVSASYTCIRILYPSTFISFCFCRFFLYRLIFIQCIVCSCDFVSLLVFKSSCSYYFSYIFF